MRLSLPQRLSCLRQDKITTHKAATQGSSSEQQFILCRPATSPIPSPHKSKSSGSSILTDTLWALSSYSDLKKQKSYYWCPEFPPNTGQHGPFQHLTQLLHNSAKAPHKPNSSPPAGLVPRPRSQFQPPRQRDTQSSSAPPGKQRLNGRNTFNS